MEVTKLYAENLLDPETQMHYNFINQLKFTVGIHCHDFFEIFLISSGNVIHNVNNNKQILSEGAMVLIRPDDAHFYERYGTGDCQFINIAFSKRTLNDLFKYLGEGFCPDRLLSGLIPPVVQLSASDKATVKSKLEGLALLPPSDKGRIKTGLRMLLADFLSNYFYMNNNDKKTVPLWLVDIIDLMERKESFKEGLPFIQKVLSRNYEYFSRTFKAYFGRTPTDYINELRLNYVVNMLVHSDMDILSIALDAGFNNLSHFYHMFKKRYGLSPLKFRNLNGIMNRLL